MSVIYLLSSLPMLRYTEKPGITVPAFLDTCRSELPASMLEGVTSLLTGRDSNHPFVKRWQEKENILLNAVVNHRARTQGKEAQSWLVETHQSDGYVENMVNEALQQSDPLLREDALNRTRWQVAEELQGSDNLGKNAVYVYAIKLRLATWRAELDQTQGEQSLHNIAQITPDRNAENNSEMEV